MAFKYRGNSRTVETVMKRAKQSGGGYDSYVLPDFTMFKPREGENQIRILPATWDDLEKYGNNWEIPIFLHYRVGADGGAYLCSKMMLKKACPVCDARAEMTDDEWAEASPKWRGLIWLIDRDNEQIGPQWWAMPLRMFRDVNNRAQDKKLGGVIKIDHPEDGYDIMFNREGRDLRTQYTALEVSREASAINEKSEKKQNQWLEYIEENPLPSILQFYEYEHIEKVLLGKTENRRKTETEEEEEVAPTKRRRARPDAEDEEEDARSRRARSEEAEDEEVASSKRRRAKDEPEAPNPRFHRVGPRSAASEEEEVAPTRRRRTGKEPDEEELPFDVDKPRSARRREEDADDDAATEGTGEEEEAEKPTPRRRRAAPVDDDEEEAGRRDRTVKARRTRDDDEEDEASTNGKGREDDEGEEDAPRGRRAEARGGKTVRRPVRAADAEETPSRQAQRALGRLRRE